ncbi:MAG: phosphonate ABC transporter ATP-binding protein [Rhodoferax sp.]|nr:phosphonate ABC transporter ATP-binding protein [Rhodoferax sp.]
MHTLHLRNLSKRFGNTTAVDGVSLSLSSGSFVGIIGRSGAGKSTLLRMINRLNEPTSGIVEFDGAVVTDLQGVALRQWRRNCAMVFQQFNLIGRLDVLTNVLMGRLTSVPTWRSLLTLWSDADKLAALEALDRFGMADFAAQRCDQLSGGQQQRVALCRALVQQPKIILADEPIASLDPRNTQVVMDALASINRDLGITVLCNLHALDVARNYCDRLVGMSAGRVVFDGAPAELTDRVVQDLYGLEAAQVMPMPAPPESHGATVLPFVRAAQSA